MIIKIAKRITLSLFFVILNVDVCFSQQDIVSFGERAERLDVEYGTLLSGFLAVPANIKELDLSPQQIKELHSVVVNNQDSIKSEISEHRKLLDQENGSRLFQEACVRTFENASQSLEKGIGKHLVEVQHRKLMQMFNRSLIEYLGGTVNFLKTRIIRDELEISDEQLKILVSDSRKLNEEFDKELTELKEKYRSKLFSTLQPKQRKKLEKLVGNKEFERKNTRKNTASRY